MRWRSAERHKLASRRLRGLWLRVMMYVRGKRLEMRVYYEIKQSDHIVTANYGTRNLLSLR